MTDNRMTLFMDLEKYLKSLQNFGITHLSISPELKKNNIYTQKNREEKTGHITVKSAIGDLSSPLIFLWDHPSDENLAERSEQKILEIVEKGMKLNRENICICCIEKNSGDSTANNIKNIQNFLYPLKPKVIVVMGNVAASALGHKIEILTDRGKWLFYGKIKVMATHHPAYLLENYTEKIRREIFQDMKKVLKELETN